MIRLAAAFLAIVSSLGISPTCLNAAGDAVDWFFVYKHHGGLDYAYVDARSELTPNASLQLTGLDLSDAASPLMRTLTQIVAPAHPLARALWNDEIPTSDAAPPPAPIGSGTNGHAKGVLASDAGGGFLLSHTLPKFPVLSGSAVSWGASSPIYAQTFLCLSLATAGIEAAADALQRNDIATYDSAVPAGLAAALPSVTALVAGQRKAGMVVATLETTPGGVSFRMFAKSGSVNLDLYEDFVQPNLKVDLFVETWRRSPAMETYCRPAYAYNSMNVENMTFTDASGSSVFFKYTVDHSKWAISTPAGEIDWMCSGDINRMTSQWARGGGTICSANSGLRGALAASIVYADECS